MSTGFCSSPVAAQPWFGSESLPPFAPPLANKSVLCVVHLSAHGLFARLAQRRHGTIPVQDLQAWHNMTAVGIALGCFGHQLRLCNKLLTVQILDSRNAHHVDPGADVL